MGCKGGAERAAYLAVKGMVAIQVWWSGWYGKELRVRWSDSIADVGRGTMK